MLSSRVNNLFSNYFKTSLQKNRHFHCPNLLNMRMLQQDHENIWGFAVKRVLKGEFRREQSDMFGQSLNAFCLQSKFGVKIR